MPIIDIIFYAIFISQIYLISYHYPKKTYDRNEYILKNFPAAEYPKLYGHSKFTDPASAIRKSIRKYLFANIAIALFGLGILITMTARGYAPSSIKENQDLIFVMFFFLLQAAPHLFFEITTYNWLKNMRLAAKSNNRKAELSPRKLFDFISPLYMGIAIIAFISWVVFYLNNKGFSTPWDWQTYITIFGMTGMNCLLIVLGYKMLRGNKQDPHQAYKDQKQMIKTMIHIYVFASILMSTQLIVFDAINQYGWDKFEPAVLSVYFQVVIIFGIGKVMRMLKVDDIDFDVYKQKPELV